MSSSPFDLLSMEVIQEIFLSCLPEDDLAFLPETHVVRLAISQVSSLLRSIALDTLQLWDNLHLSVSNDWQQAESALRFAWLCLHRAGRLPITLNVWTRLPQNNPHIQELHRLISSHRFKSLTGDLEAYWLPLHNRSYEGSFASLESLNLSINENPSQADQSPDSDNYCQMPSLRHLRIAFPRKYLPWQGAMLHMIPWHQLSKLILHSITDISIMMGIMCECKALVECNLFFIEHPAEDFVFPSTSLPHLRNLILCSSSPIADLNKLLSVFNVPNLTSIYIQFPWGSQLDNSFWTDLLSGQMDVPLQRLQEFTFVHVENVVNVRMILRHMPSLRRLKLSGSVLLDQDTAKQISTGQLGPHINTLSLRFCSSVKRVLNMIEKRQENAKFDEGRNLAHFIHVQFCCPVDLGVKYKERVERLERQYNMRIQMDPLNILGFIDDESEEDD